MSLSKFPNHEEPSQQFLDQARSHQEKSKQKLQDDAVRRAFTEIFETHHIPYGADTNHYSIPGSWE